MKKLISLVTAGMLAMSLAACGSSGSGSAAAGGSSASSEPTTVTVYCMSFNNIPEDSEVTRVENLMYWWFANPMRCMKSLPSSAQSASVKVALS